METCVRRALGRYGRVIVADPSIRTKVQAIEYVLDRLLEIDAIDRPVRDKAETRILQRERLGSTGIGQGVALPHASIEGFEKAVGIVADFQHGVDFDSIDKEPVYRMFLLLAPVARPGDNFRVLRWATHALRLAR